MQRFSNLRFVLSIYLRPGESSKAARLGPPCHLDKLAKALSCCKVLHRAAASAIRLSEADKE